MHSVKVERHDTLRRQHHTNTGIREVDFYREHDHGLYVARPFYGHPRIAYWQAHLLPALGVQLCRYTLHGGRRDFDYYLDIARIRQEDGLWEMRDLYLDVVLWEGVRAEILDTDELLEARRAQFVSEEEALYAVERAHVILNQLAQHAYRPQEWLRAQGIVLEWREPVLA
ncbi:DUF402 domain-containing protein [Deinococcus peraridilitoris]|uniref:DUF402 domain-containing protein n=1 Tax=Deinococcus peraridilitoris (strain DSM 19664 / LMG 22246 / CIP 109416 / KR-200) TaxID=937777 RepID=L0A320_DEIPD|nr:DUF402 domain-containing protein [Deinococcus peraridilitoris]AFZ68288.1 hypothetical protein Deipe_2824 [Deinococcus peraridilitoris DSM 19664]